MLRRTLVTRTVAAAAALGLAPLVTGARAGSSATIRTGGIAMNQTATPVALADGQTGYAPVNGLQMYYEVHGEGEPLVLLHGAFAPISLWGPILETLAAERQVIAVEFQGHGHTADIDRPFDYDFFADDVNALMDYLGLAQADIVGYSMGGTTGLRLTMLHPDKVRKLVAISANYRTDAYPPEDLAAIQGISVEAFSGTPLETAFMEAAPNPEDWPVVIEKMKALEANEFAWPEEEVSAISAPVMLVAGDADGPRPEHTVQLFRLLGGGASGDLHGLSPHRLLVLPATSHVGVVLERPSVWLPLVDEFLDAPMPDGQ